MEMEIDLGPAKHMISPNSSRDQNEHNIRELTIVMLFTSPE